MNKEIKIKKQIWLILLLLGLLILQSCEFDSISSNSVENQKKQLEEIEKTLNENTQDNTDELDKDKLTQDLLNPLFTLMDISTINATVDIEETFQDLESLDFHLVVDNKIKLNFFETKDKKGITIENYEESKSGFIEINKQKAEVKGGEYDKYIIQISSNYLYLFNKEGAYIFTNY